MIKPRRELEIARTREDILVAAARALTRGGFKVVSLQEIAAEVGFTAPALYAYFSSKEAIFAALVELLDSELAETFAPPLARGTSLRERVTGLVRRQLEWTDRRRDLFIACFSLHMRGEAPAAGGGGPEAYLALASRWFKRAAPDRGGLGQSSCEDAACLLMGVIHGFFVRWISRQGSARLADQTDTIVDLFLHGVSGPPGPRSKRS